MKRPQVFCHVLLFLGAIGVRTLPAQVGGRVKDTVHNLSVSGPGTIRATTETEICVFCHTPHGGGDARPLWNRSTASGPYLIYQSSSLRAQVGQPTGSSKLCLSCHDGTIALGNVLSRPQPISLGGTERMPPGRSNLGTDLSDDHPVSFVYPSTTGTSGSELVPPQAIQEPVTLDHNLEVQCTACHEPHDNTNGKFLVRSNVSGALCTSCHIMGGWSSSVHASSSAAVTADAAQRLGADVDSVARNACKSCHRTHGAESHSWLLHHQGISKTCIECHDGTVAAGNIKSEVAKLSSHGILIDGVSPTPGGPYLEGAGVSCADCHDPHATGGSGGPSASLPASLVRVPGVTLNGTPTPQISAEHELCFRCHGDTPARTRGLVNRVIVQPNTRLQFQPTNPSFHPVGNPGASASVPSLIPPLTTTSLVTCGDCHSSDDSSAFGGNGPRGPHGSIHPPLLLRRYDTMDFSVESASAYALCYRCHERESILSDRSFKEHRRHIVEERTPCSACHDAHGISSGQGNVQANSHLVNFDRSIVFPGPGGRLEFKDLGQQHGECSLLCHGENHDAEDY